MELVLANNQNKQADLFSVKEADERRFGDLISISDILKIYESSWIDDWFRDKKEKAE